MMSRKKNVKKKNKAKHQKQNTEKKNLDRIQEVKEEDRAKRTRKNARKAKERTEKAKREKSDLYREEININGEDLLKEVPADYNIVEKKNEKSKKGTSVKESSKKKVEARKGNNKKSRVTKKEKLDLQNKTVLKRLEVTAYSIISVAAIFLVILVILSLRPKFKDITIELGTTDLTATDFLVSSIYKNGASLVTDLDSIDLLSVQETDITLDFKGKKETVKLNIVDTTAPTVEFKDMMAYLDYVPNADDFIESKEDYSEMTTELVSVPEFSDYGTYEVTVKVTDACGNETVGTCELMITWLLQEVYIEFGGEFSVADVVIDVDRFGSLVPEEELAKVNTMELGTYEINVTIDGEVYTCNVIVQDTTPPDLVLQNITIWDDETISGWESFVVSATDLSGEVTTECTTEIDYSIIGAQTITIKATDVNGNVNEQTCTLTIKRDTTGPVISGLSNMTVNKYSTPDYQSGVSATDDKDGSVSFTVDSSAVNTSAAGTYYVTYKATDSAGNTTTSKRKVTVNWDQDDVNAKVTEFYNSYCAGLSAEGITSVVKSKISYSSANYSTRSACIYNGLTNRVGNCFVHAYILQALLNKAGYSCQIIYVRDGAHCWNKVGSTHYDSTPGRNHVLTAYSDEEKLAETWLSSRGYTAEDFVIIN